MRKLVSFIAVLLMVSACSSSQDDNPPSDGNSKFMQQTSDLLSGEVMAMAYSGFREKQHPDRGMGANNQGAPRNLAASRDQQP